METTDDEKAESTTTTKNIDNNDGQTSTESPTANVVIEDDQGLESSNIQNKDESTADGLGSKRPAEETSDVDENAMEESPPKKVKEDREEDDETAVDATQMSENITEALGVSSE